MGIAVARGTGIGTAVRRTSAGFKGGLRLDLLGGFRLTDNGEVLHLPLGAQRLLAFLGLHERALLRIHIASSLWLDSDEEHSSANLRSTLWRVRAANSHLVHAGVDQLELHADVRVDLHQSDALATSLLNEHHADDEQTGAETQLSADLLPDWYEEWVVFERERHRQLRLHALETLCERLVRRGLLARAVAAGVAAVQGEPLRESAHRVLIKAYLEEGNRAEALRQYRRYSQLLADELQLQPAPEMVELVASLLPR